MAQTRTDGILRLPPEAASVPAARRFVRARLSSAGLPGDLVDSVEVCISELVTNGVLHARTEFEVRVELLGPRLRLEIRDWSDAVPRHVVRGSSATTGRGLDMVRVLCADWGVTLVEDGGKVVWCELAPDAGGAAPDSVDLLSAWPELDAQPEESALAGPVVALLRYPVRRAIRSREHVEALMRECVLVAQTMAGGKAPAQLVELAAAVSARHSSSMSRSERLTLAAAERGDASVDLEFPLSDDTAPVMRAYQATFAALDAYAADNRLLTLQTPTDVAELRDWVVAELIAQASGRPANPWPGPLD